MRSPRLSPAAVGRGVTAAALALAAAVSGAASATAAPPTHARVLGADLPGTITDRYIVVLKDGATEAREVRRSAQTLTGRLGGAVHAAYDGAVRGFTARLSRDGAARLAAHPAVAFVEQDRAVRVATTQAGPTWGLDRIDQRNLPLSRSYTYPRTGAGVTAYVLDTGVRTSHQEFGGRASSGYDFVDGDTDAGDCQGHGTHVAGTIAGATHGVAKGATIVSVRVLDCAGTGSYSAIMAGVDWVTRNAARPAVANLSLGGGASTALDTAVRASVAAGVTYVVAAGNSSADACTGSPARTAEAVTVGATDAADGRASFSNVGSCLDLFAPGVGILSAGHSGDAATASMSGTSMAAPHAAGAAALYLEGQPGATAAQVHAALVADATAGVVRNPGTGSPNRLLFTGAQPAPDAPTPTPSQPTPAPTQPTPDPTQPTPSPSQPTPTPTACVRTDDTDRPVRDGRTTVGAVTVAGCGGRASATSTVAVRIRHADRGDLSIRLVAPDGSAYLLRRATAGDDVADLDATYRVDLSARRRDGTWRLQVTDAYAGDTGRLDAWTLAL